MTLLRLIRRIRARFMLAIGPVRCACPRPGYCMPDGSCSKCGKAGGR